MSEHAIPVGVYQDYPLLELAPDAVIENVSVSAPDWMEKPELAKMLRLLADSLDG